MCLPLHNLSSKDFSKCDNIIQSSCNSLTDIIFILQRFFVSIIHSISPDFISSNNQSQSQSQAQAPLSQNELPLSTSQVFSAWKEIFFADEALFLRVIVHLLHVTTTFNNNYDNYFSSTTSEIGSVGAATETDTDTDTDSKIVTDSTVDIDIDISTLPMHSFLSQLFSNNIPNNTWNKKMQQKQYVQKVQTGFQLQQYIRYNLNMIIILFTTRLLYFIVSISPLDTSRLLNNILLPTPISKVNTRKTRGTNANSTNSTNVAEGEHANIASFTNDRNSSSLAFQNTSCVSVFLQLYSLLQHYSVSTLTDVAKTIQNVYNSKYLQCSQLKSETNVDLLGQQYQSLNSSLIESYSKVLSLDKIVQLWYYRILSTISIRKCDPTILPTTVVTLESTLLDTAIDDCSDDDDDDNADDDDTTDENPIVFDRHAALPSLP